MQSFKKVTHRQSEQSLNSPMTKRNKKDETREEYMGQGMMEMEKKDMEFGTFKYLKRVTINAGTELNKDPKEFFNEFKKDWNHELSYVLSEYKGIIQKDVTEK